MSGEQVRFKFASVFEDSQKLFITECGIEIGADGQALLGVVAVNDSLLVCN